MKRELFRCDYCEIQRFDSETQNYIPLPFTCGTLAEWKQHIKRPKHNMNIARNENLVDELVKECKHCNGIFTIEQYKQHQGHNQLLWATSNPIYKDCSCNNFVYNNKRFENLKLLRAYAECRYENGRKKYKYVPKPTKVKSFKERGEAIKNHIEEKKKNKNKEKKEEPIQENIVMTIEDEFKELNGIPKEDPKTDLNEPPIWDDEDMCYECGKPDNSFRNYSKYKLEKYEVSLCDCDSDYEDSDYE